MTPTPTINTLSTEPISVEPVSGNHRFCKSFAAGSETLFYFLCSRSPNYLLLSQIDHAKTKAQTILALVKEILLNDPPNVPELDTGADPLALVKLHPSKQLGLNINNSCKI